MDSFFEQGVKLIGTLWVKGAVHFDGEMEGEIYSSDHFKVGKVGVIKGDIRSFNVTNMGRVKGNLYAKNRVSLANDSNLVGDISTFNLIVDEGSSFEGRCKMLEAPPKVVPTEKKASSSWERKKNGNNKG